jgi:hypothetical protein
MFSLIDWSLFMFLSLFSFRRLLATSFLLVFVNVFVGAVLVRYGKPGSGGSAPGGAGAPRKARASGLPWARGPGGTPRPAQGVFVEVDHQPRLL